MSSAVRGSITARTTVDEVVTRYPVTVQVFIRRRMHCVGCQIDRFHSIAEACRIYGQPLKPFLTELRSATKSGSHPMATRPVAAPVTNRRVAGERG